MGRQGPLNVSTQKMQGKVHVFLSSQYMPATAEATAGPALYSTCEESIFIIIWQVRKRGPESRAPKHLHQSVLYYLFSFISHHLLPVLMSETPLETHRASSLCSAFAQVVTVNFMCHLDWPTGYPDIWSNIIPGVTVKVFLDEINI